MPAKLPLSWLLVAVTSFVVFAERSTAWGQDAVVAADSTESRYGGPHRCQRERTFHRLRPQGRGGRALAVRLRRLQDPESVVPHAQARGRLEGPALGPGGRDRDAVHVPGQGAQSRLHHRRVRADVQRAVRPERPLRLSDQECQLLNVFLRRAQRPRQPAGLRRGRPRASCTSTAADEPGHVDRKPQDSIVYELHVQDYTARLAGLRPRSAAPISVSPRGA